MAAHASPRHRAQDWGSPPAAEGDPRDDASQMIDSARDMILDDDSVAEAQRGRPLFVVSNCAPARYQPLRQEETDRDDEHDARRGCGAPNSADVCGDIARDDRSLPRGAQRVTIRRLRHHDVARPLAKRSSKCYWPAHLDEA